MNKLKRVFVAMVSLVLACVCMFGLTACSQEDIVEAKFNISIYDTAENEMNNFSLDVDLYGHLAPKTVKNISKYIKNGYYDNTVFYKLDGYDKQFMIGDLKYDPEQVENEGFSLNEKMPTVDGEFEYGGTTGSNLRHKRGSIGLWRSWAAQDYSYNMGRTGTDSGSATLFMTTDRMQAYDGYFCVFATYDVEGDNEETLTELEYIFDSSDIEYEQFVIYYTGEYGNLTFHCVKGGSIDEDKIDGLFKAREGSAELVCYNPYTINVPMTSDGQVAAKITSARIK